MIGGGLAGLAAGATAASSGAATLVLEAHSPGGRARVTKRQGFVFNLGGHALYLGGPGDAVLRSLGLRPAGRKPPLDRYRLYIDDAMHLLPTNAGTLLRTRAIGQRSKAQLTRLLSELPRVDPDRLNGTSVSQWIGDLGLRSDADKVVRALVRLSTYCNDLDELGADAAVAQLQLAGRSGVLYLDGGWAQLSVGLGRAVEVRQGTPARAVIPEPTGFTVEAGGARLRARTVVVAVGTPQAAKSLLPQAPPWVSLGGPVTAACLDAGVRRVPEPGYVLGADDPLYASTQSPPARQARDGHAVMAVVRYGARSAVEDKLACEGHLWRAGVRPDDVVTSRFLARMVVMGAAPSAAAGGRRGRPSVADSGLPGLYVAGDWVGAEGLLADTALASGRSAALAALKHIARSATMVA